MKRTLITLLFIALAIANAMAYDYDFSAKCESGQTLYYTITSSVEPFSVMVTYPYYYDNTYYHNHSKPTGNLTIPDTIINGGIKYAVKSISDNAFSDCSGLTSVTIPNSVTSIGECAFVRCSSLTTVTISDSVTYIGGCAFYESGLVNVSIPNSVKYVGDGAFHKCANLQLNNYGNSSYLGNSENPYVLLYSSSENNINSNCRIIYGEAFRNCQTITSIGIPNGVSHLGGGAFEGCSNLRSVSIPNSVLTFGWGVFYGCSSLTSVVIPESVTSMSNDVFGGCTNLKTISIPNSLEYFGTNLFHNCNNLQFNEYDNALYLGNEENPFHLLVKAKNTDIASCSIHPDTKILLNNNMYRTSSLTEEERRSAFGGCNKLENITIPEGAVRIGDGAFYKCSGLKNVIIAKSVLSVGEYAFAGCSNIQTIKSKNYNAPIMINRDGITERNDAAGNTFNLASFGSVNTEIPIYIPCKATNNYRAISDWNVFNNFIEVFLYDFNVQTEDTVKGTAEITKEPTCSENATIKATAKSGYIFYQWSDGNSDNPRSITIDRDTTIIAQFVPDEISFTLSSSNTSQGTVTESLGTYHYYDKVTFSATANYGYHFSQWSDGVTKNPRTIQLIKDTVIEAQFAVNQYSIQLQSNDTNMGSANGAGSFDYLSTNKISATPKTGFVFHHWSDENTDNPRTITLTRDTAFTAVFVPDEVSVEVVSADTEHGTVTELSGVYHFNEKIFISAIAVPHHHFVAWSDGNRQNPRELLLRGDTVLTATFGIDTFSVAAKCDTAMGAVSGAGLYSYGSAAKVEAKPAAHHHFVQWTSGAVQTTQEFVVEHDTAFEAVFAIDRHSVVLAASDSLCGAVSGAGSYDYGASVQLQATPAANCYFTGWSDGVTTNPRTLTVEGDTNIVAEFGKLQTVNIMVAANDTLRGTVAGTGSYVVGSNATLSATASAHYLFEQWSDGRTDNPRTVRAIADATYTAVFVPMQYNIILSQNNADMGMVSGSGVYSYGERVSCLAKPYPNYHFVQWSNGETANPYEFVVEEDKMLTAYFAAGAVTAIGNESAAEPTIYAIGKTIVVENATDEICVYDAMGKLICRDVACRVRAELRVNAAGVYIVKTGNVVMRVVVE